HIVIATSSDLADAGLIKSLGRPGGNLTGIADNSEVTAAKRFELLRELLPRASRVGLLNNPDFPATPKIERLVQAAVQRAGVTVHILHARDRAALDAVLDGIRPKEIDALLLGGDGLFVAHSRALIERATALRIPVVHFWPTTAGQGALLVHAPDVLENFKRSASYVDRILKGAHPGDLPIYQPTRYELVVNLKAARALGILVPQGFLLRVDRVIE
ncbi:MAG: ABC transporter substrate-binding protein, partial [Panacagrimonas sp.]